MNHANDNGKPITFISMFSGIEAASVAFGPLGWKAICFAEIEKFPSAVLAHHYPDVPNVGDMSKHDWAQYRGKVDIVCGGPPCQDFSIAGLRAGLDGERGNLSIVYMRALHAIKPRNAIVENVPGWLNDKKNAFGCFLAGLVGADDPLRTPDGKSWPNAGMVAGPLGRAAWRVLDAQYFGLAQRRRRVIVVADFGNGADPAAVLFERKGLFGNTPPSREAGKSITHPVAPSLVSCGRGVERTGDTRGQDPVVAVEWPAEVASTLNAAFGEKLGLENQHINSGAPLFVPSAVCVTGDVTHTLKSEGADASEDGTGRGTPIICFTAKDYGADAQEELAPTLRSGNSSGSHANGGVMPAVTVAIRGRDGGATAELGGDIATALRASQGGGDKPHVLATRDVAGAITSNYGKQFDNSDTAIGPNVANHHSAVRRLTPVECERLQGFPDGYTDIPWRGKPNSPDGPRYRALGNSWAVPKFVWLGERIQKLMPVANDNQETPIANAA